MQEIDLLPQLNLIGYLQSSKGLGQIARGYQQALGGIGTPFTVCDLSDMIEERAQGLEAGIIRSASSNQINLVVTNPMEVTLAEQILGQSVFFSKYNIGAWWWELLGAPPSGWKSQAHMFDEIWAGSTFVQKVFQEHFSLPVHLIPPLVQIASCGKLTRADFGLRQDEFIFLFVCDFNSIPERKNPLAVVKAFKIAFPDREQARLLIKVSNPNAYPDYWMRLKEACAADDITLFDGDARKDEVDTLMHLCDCYVSLHRSEGFGLTIAEALLAGKPVVATGWSGNMDYMSEDNSWPVPYKLVQITEDHGPYIRGHFWAEPDVEAAAGQLRFVFENAEAVKARTLRGSETIQRLYSLEAVTERLRSNLERLSSAASFIGRLARQRTFAHSMQPTTESDVVNARPAGAATPTVSVCLPVFNGETYLAEAIDSVLGQTYKDFELLIADDQSTDSSLSIARVYAQRDKRIRCWQNPQRLGLFANYNQCISQSAGKFIKPFAQDDILDPRMLEVAVGAMERYPSVALFSGGRTFINELGIEWAPNYLEELFRVSLPVGTVTPGKQVIRQCLFPLVNRIGEPSAVMFPRRLAADGFDQTFHHVGDLDLWIRLLLAGTYYGSTDPLCKFRIHTASATSRNVASLLFGTDILKLGRKLESVFAGLGLNRHEFIDSAIAAIAAEVSNMPDVNLHFGATELTRAVTKIEVEGFRDLAIHALRRMTRSTHPVVSEYGALQCAHQNDTGRRIVALEAQIGDMLDSPSWKITRPLRDLKRVLSFSSLRSGGPPDETSAEIMDDQTEYLLYLTRLELAITRSRSWLITRLMRKCH